ncbi:MAG TPA: o-succinylbenzoate synthase, partial [Thermoanaerobaculia bacterium]
MAITVHEIELREIRLRLVEPFRISSGETRDRRILLVRLAGSSDGGRTAAAWGECVAGEYPSYGYETIDTARLAIREWLAPRLLGRPFGHPREVFGRLDRNLRGHRMAKAALEMASWELAARLAGEAGEPLAGLLGGERRAVATGVSLGIQDSPEALAAKGRAALERGYRKVKAKIRPGEDREFLAALRAGLGPDAPLAVDANAAYRVEDFDHLASLDEFRLMMLEQPLEGGDLLRHARLQERIATPICLDESIDTPTRAADMIELGAGRIVNIKPGRVGGFGPAIEIHDLCRAAGVPVWCGGMLESGVGRSHNVALASLPGFT